MFDTEQERTESDGNAMIHRLQNPIPQPKAIFDPRPKRRDAKCRECGAVYLNSRREFCPKCDTYGVEEIR